MGEPTSRCSRDPDGWCLELHEIVIILVALIVLVQVALKVAALICYYLLHLFMAGCRAAFAKETVKVKTAPHRSKKLYSRKPSVQWSDQNLSHRHESSSPPHRCLHCTLEPLKVTMNVRNNNDDCPCTEHQHVGHLPYPSVPPNQPTHYHTCECENRNRPRTTPAPSGYITTRYRDVAVGNSDPMMPTHHVERRNAMASGFEPFPRSQVAELPYYPYGMGHPPEMEHPGYTQRSRRPTKVYIYPVHPQTPPGSRTVSPDRAFRRRGTLSPEDQLEYENRNQRRKSRDVEQDAMAMHFHSHGTGQFPGPGGQAEGPSKKQSYLWPEEPPTSDWVYRPMK